MLVGIKTMDHVYISDPCSLKEDEMEYEFCLRATPVRGGLRERQQNLRALLQKPEDPVEVHFSTYSLAEDLVKIPRQLKEMERCLDANLDDDCYSRLVHYHKRLRRYSPGTEEHRQQRKALLDSIERLSRRYYNIDLAHVCRQVPLMRIHTVHSNLATATPGQLAQELVDLTTDFEEGAVGGILDDRLPRASFVSSTTTQRTLQPSLNPYTGTKPKASRDLLAAPVPAPRGQSSYNQWLSGFSPAATRQSELGRPMSNPQRWEQSAAAGVDNSTLAISEDPRRKAPPLGGFARTLFEPTSGSAHPLPPQQQPQPGNMGRSAATSSPTPTIQNEPADERDMNEFIHASDVQNYIRACLEHMMRQQANGASVLPEAVDELAEQVAKVDLRRDSEMLRISQDQPPARRVPSPPFQLSARETSGKPEMRSMSRGEGLFELPEESQVHGESRRRQESNPAPGPSWDVNRRFPDVQTLQGERYRRLPHQQCNIIEKWPKFTGGTNSVPVVDFLRQINIMCESYHISKQDLRMHAHLLFREGAAVWYTTYHDRFDSWETLETYLRLRYDNPNRDLITRDLLDKRKQRPNEPFGEYLEEIERLAQRLTRKMSHAELYYLVTKNMKMSYKRSLVLATIQSLDHLSQLCYKLDALDGLGGLQKASVHQVDMDERAAEIDEELLNADVCAVHGRFKKLADSTGENRKPMCWNCRQAGHMWRECDQKKVYFCHVCGHTGTTAFQCPNGHPLRTRSDEEEKNE